MNRSFALCGIACDSRFKEDYWAGKDAFKLYGIIGWSKGPEKGKKDRKLCLYFYREQVI